ncbi:aromatic acid exporter family protein [Staphylococcus simulans]|uniref:aromatic acid exporter family protein n=1 Tax=Staphylococcus simulans TaxID=1286 RepID=UPI000D02D7FE|nr:aromatic acid exporter family protein [Staphylococcus simulans]
MMRFNPYKIGFRTIKTAVGMALGIIIAKLIGLDNFSSSAILVVLCIKHTKVHSLQAIVSRFVSCILILIIGSFAFSLLGQSAIVLGLIVLFFIPLTVMLKVQEGIITSCVILLHVFNAKVIDLHLFINEILLLIVGLGIAFIMNLIMPSLDKQLKKYKYTIEKQFTEIFYSFSKVCYDTDFNLNVPLKEIEKEIQKAKSYAFRDVKNHYVRNENSYYHYFDMREEQLEIIERIEQLLKNIKFEDKMVRRLGNLFAEIAKNVNSNDYTAMRLYSLYELHLDLYDQALPQSKEALINRANEIQIVNELERYLQIKSHFGSLKLYDEI